MLQGGRGLAAKRFDPAAFCVSEEREAGFDSQPKVSQFVKVVREEFGGEEAAV